MKIEMNTIYHLPTRELEDDFLKQAEEQGLTWSSGTRATKKKFWNNEEHCISVLDDKLGYSRKSFYEYAYPKFPIIEWKLGFTKADMQIGQLYKVSCGGVGTWRESDGARYADDLKANYSNIFDVVEVYPLNLTPIWKREEPKYKVKTELTKEQAEKLGLEFCEEVTE